MFAFDCRIQTQHFYLHPTDVHGTACMSKCEGYLICSKSEVTLEQATGRATGMGAKAAWLL